MGYLNDEWQAYDGGELRLFEEDVGSCPYRGGLGCTQIRHDVQPIGNRLLVFWATEKCPHEVLPNLGADRFAVTTWVRDGRQVMSKGRREMGVEVAMQLQPVKPLSVSAALEAVGCDEAQARRLERLHEIVARRQSAPESESEAALAQVINMALLHEEEGSDDHRAAHAEKMIQMAME